MVEEMKEPYKGRRGHDLATPARDAKFVVGMALEEVGEGSGGKARSSRHGA